MPRKAKVFAPIKPRSSAILSDNPDSIRAREYAQSQFGWDVQRRRIQSKYRARRSRALAKLEESLMYRQSVPQDQEKLAAELVESLDNSMDEELAMAHAEWLERTGQEPDDSSSAEESGGAATKDSDEEEYEEWNGIDSAEPIAPKIGEKRKREDDERMDDELDVEEMGPALNRIRRKFEKRYLKNIERFEKIGAIENEGDD